MGLGWFCMHRLLFCSHHDASISAEGKAFKKKNKKINQTKPGRWREDSSGGDGGTGLQKNNQRSSCVSSSIIDFHMQVYERMIGRERRGRIALVRNINNSHLFKCIHLSQLFFFTFSVFFFFNHIYVYKTICPQFQVVREVCLNPTESQSSSSFKKRLQQYGNVLSSGTLPALTLYINLFFPNTFLFGKVTKHWNARERNLNSKQTTVGCQKC